MGILDSILEGVGEVFKPGGLAYQAYGFYQGKTQLRAAEKAGRRAQQTAIQIAQAGAPGGGIVGTTALTPTVIPAGMTIPAAAGGFPGQGGNGGPWSGPSLPEQLGNMRDWAFGGNGGNGVRRPRHGIYIQSTHHTTPLGQRVPNKVSFIMDPESGIADFYVHAGRPTAWSGVTIKKRLHHHHRPRLTAGRHHHHPR